MKLFEFLWFMLRPRMIRAYLRLGSFECVCWSYNFWLLKMHSRIEQLKS